MTNAQEHAEHTVAHEAAYFIEDEIAAVGVAPNDKIAARAVEKALGKAANPEEIRALIDMKRVRKRAVTVYERGEHLR